MQENKSERPDTGRSRKDVMALVRDFDRQLGGGEDYRYGSDQAITGIFLTAACVVILLPAQMIPGRFEVCPIVSGIFSLAAAGFRLKRYIYIRENDKVESIYSRMRFLPLSKWAIFRARAAYAARFSLSSGAVFLVLQHLGALLNRQWSFWNVIYPSAAAVGMLLAGVLYSMPWTELVTQIHIALQKMQFQRHRSTQ